MASARATSAIIRSRLILRICDLMRPFMWGSPSDWRCSSLISCLVIFRLLLILWRW